MPKNSTDDMGNDADVVTVAIAIVLSGGKVLVGKRRSDADLGGFDEFPGGKVDEHESPERAAVRECLEETGLSIETDRRLDIVQHQYDHASVSLHFFLCSLPATVDSSDNLKAPFRWVPVAKLNECNFPPANDSIIAALMRT